MLGVRYEKEGKLRVTYAGWDDAKVVLNGHVFRRNGAIRFPPLSSHPLEKPEGVRAELWDHPMPQKRAESSPLFKAESVMLGIRHEHRRRRRSAGSKALARELDEAADATVRAMDEVVSAPAALAVYRRDQDVPPLNV